MSIYLQGSEARIPATFADQDGNAVDPTTVSFGLRKVGTSTVTTYVHGVDSEVVKSETGSYHVDYLFSEAGRFVYRWESEGTGAAAFEKRILVQKKRVTIP